MRVDVLLGHPLQVGQPRVVTGAVRTAGRRAEGRQRTGVRVRPVEATALPLRAPVVEVVAAVATAAAVVAPLVAVTAAAVAIVAVPTAATVTIVVPVVAPTVAIVALVALVALVTAAVPLALTPTIVVATLAPARRRQRPSVLPVAAAHRGSVHAALARRHHAAQICHRHAVLVEHRCAGAVGRASHAGKRHPQGVASLPVDGCRSRRGDNVTADFLRRAPASKSA